VLIAPLLRRETTDKNSLSSSLLSPLVSEMERSERHDSYSTGSITCSGYKSCASTGRHARANRRQSQPYRDDRTIQLPPVCGIASLWQTRQLQAILSWQQRSYLSSLARLLWIELNPYVRGMPFLSFPSGDGGG
jgi:hypothetical protein